MSRPLSLLRPDGADAAPGDGEAAHDGPDGRRRVPNRVLIISAGVAVLLAALLTWLVAFSPVLGVHEVTVRGTHTLTAAQVRAAAAIRAGTPLVRLDTADVRRRVTALPDVASATVSVSYPQTVVIAIVERRPVGFLAVGTRYVLVDKTGDQYRTVTSAPRALPRFTVPEGPPARATGEALAAVAASLDPRLRSRVASIEGFDPTAITLLLTDQRVVRWGSADRSADKARILPTLLTQPGSTFDVSNPDLVVAR